MGSAWSVTKQGLVKIGLAPWSVGNSRPREDNPMMYNKEGYRGLVIMKVGTAYIIIRFNY
jgi:hypothetical protein